MSLWLYVSLGTLFMMIVLLYAGRFYKVPVLKRLILAVVLAAAGVLGTKIMAFIEMGNFSGTSFFGAVLFTPFLMMLLSPLFKLPSATVLDLCAPAECAMLVLMKVNCLISGCCAGRVLYTVGQYADEVRFPSQIVEGVSAAIIMVVLLLMLRKGKQQGKLYLWYLIIYGTARFGLNLFRETTPFVWILPAGNFWSLVAIIAGCSILKYMNTHRGKA